MSWPDDIRCGARRTYTANAVGSLSHGTERASSEGNLPTLAPRCRPKRARATDHDEVAAGDRHRIEVASQVLAVAEDQRGVELRTKVTWVASSRLGAGHRAKLKFAARGLARRHQHRRVLWIAR